jgi:hypothetical protein
MAQIPPSLRLSCVKLGATLKTGGDSMATMGRIRYTRQTVTTSTFFQMPKFLFSGEFEGLSNDARVLYMLLRDRHGLSVKNKWYDENGDVYLYYKREDMEAVLNLSERTVAKIMASLRHFGLLEEVKQGQGKPNKIYLYAAIPEPGKDASDDNENPTNETPNSDPQSLSFQNRNSYGSKAVTFSGENRNFYGSEAEISTGQESQNFRLSPTPENPEFAAPAGTNLSASNNEDNKNEKNHTEGSNKNNRPAADNSACPRQFTQFWAMYPRKEGKKAAADWWAKKNPDEIMFSQIMTALEYAINYWRNAQTLMKFIPMPATWLNRTPWNGDEKVDPNVTIDGSQSFVKPSQSQRGDNPFFNALRKGADAQFKQER